MPSLTNHRSSSSPTNSTCSIMWPWFDALDYVYCVGEKRSLYDNITLRNVTIADPLLKYVSLRLPNRQKKTFNYSG